MAKKESTNRHEYSIKLEGEAWSKLVNDAFEEIRKHKTVDGFRKGKVPKNVFDKKFGKEEYLRDATNVAVQDEFIRIMHKNDYQLVAEPQIHVTTMTEEKLEFTMTLIETPEVKLKKYTGLSVKKDKVKVTKEEVEHELGHLLERYSELVVKEKGNVENGDIAIIDFEGFKDKVAFDGGKAENYSLEIGSGSFIPGFEEQLIGMKKGTEKEIQVTFPDDYHEESLKGQEVTFKVKVNEIKVKQNRELDQEFFEDLALDGVNSEETLKEEIKKSIEAQKQTDAENKYINELIETVAKQAEVDIPEEMVLETVERMFEEFTQRLALQGINLKMYEQFSGQKEADIKSEMEKEAFARILARLTLEEIKKLENISVEDKEIDERIKELTETHNMKEEELLAEIGGREMLKYDLEMNKVVDFLKDANK